MFRYPFSSYLIINVLFLVSKEKERKKRTKEKMLYKMVYKTTNTTKKEDNLAIKKEMARVAIINRTQMTLQHLSSHQNKQSVTLRATSRKPRLMVCLPSPIPPLPPLPQSRMHQSLSPLMYYLLVEVIFVSPMFLKRKQIFFRSICQGNLRYYLNWIEKTKTFIYRPNYKRSKFKKEIVN